MDPRIRGVFAATMTLLFYYSLCRLPRTASRLVAAAQAVPWANLWLGNLREFHTMPTYSRPIAREDWLSQSRFGVET